jgi:hypothetical protein
VRRRRRSIEVFTLSFLDCICCGFGAVILFYTIVSAHSSIARIRKTDPESAQVSLLEEEVRNGTLGLAALRDSLQKTREQVASASEETNRVLAELTEKRERISTYDAQTVAQREHIEKLKADVRSLQEGTQRLGGGSEEHAAPGEEVLGFRPTGGERHYITGLTMRGKHILILLDVSTSMLHEDLVTILKLRNEDDAHKRAAAKWRRAVLMVSWLLSQLPPGSAVQIYTFNTRAQPLLPDSAGHWIAGGDVPQLARLIRELQLLVPDGGTSLYNAFAAVHTLAPLPDQVVLITDGLPTQGKTAGTRKYVDSDARERLFDESIGQLPPRIPIDCVLLPMKGDSQAAHHFWYLARISNGTLIMPAKDWP